MAVSRFHREIAIAAGLHHPHILPLYDSGEAGDVTYFTMPYVEGQALDHLLRERTALPLALSVRTASQAGLVLGTPAYMSPEHAPGSNSGIFEVLRCFEVGGDTDLSGCRISRWRNDRTALPRILSVCTTLYLPAAVRHRCTAC